MRVLITGSSGQIGTNLALKLKQDGHWVFGVDKRMNTADGLRVQDADPGPRRPLRRRSRGASAASSTPRWTSWCTWPLTQRCTSSSDSRTGRSRTLKVMIAFSSARCGCRTSWCTFARSGHVHHDVHLGVLDAADAPLERGVVAGEVLDEHLERVVRPGPRRPRRVRGASAASSTPRWTSCTWPLTQRCTSSSDTRAPGRHHDLQRPRVLPPAPARRRARCTATSTASRSTARRPPTSRSRRARTPPRR